MITFEHGVAVFSTCWLKREKKTQVKKKKKRRRRGHYFCEKTVQVLSGVSVESELEKSVRERRGEAERERDVKKDERMMSR